MKTLEIQNEKTVEILYTIESIERINQTISRNKAAGMSSLYLQQWQDMKNDFIQQLKSLLAEFDINLDLKTAA
jgi:hypothetical protein